MSSLLEHDFIVIGAGSAGCVVAGRLSETGHDVLLLEAGVRSRNPWIGVPIGTPKLFGNRDLNWSYESEPEPELENRSLYHPAGKLLGGTGAINGMAYVRGHALDFDRWQREGCIGWGYQDVLPHFKASEDNVRGEGEYHAVGGPMHVADVALHRTIGDAFVSAGSQVGYAVNDDFNGAEQEGVGYFQYTYHNGRRVNPAAEYLTARRRGRLNVRTRTLVDRILFDGSRAVGVTFYSRNKPMQALARREVVVCAGTFNSPQILQRSGIGPGDLLHRHKIPVVADLPGVGENYQDHFTLQVAFQSGIADTINDDVGSRWRQMSMGARYLFGRKGPMGHTGTYSGGFIRSSPEIPHPDIELNCNLWTRNYTMKGGLLDSYSGFSLAPLYLRPDARGSVRIKSREPAEKPLIRSNSFVTDNDRRTMVRAVRAVREIANAPALRKHIVRETMPGPDYRTDEQIISYTRANGYTCFHSAGTCKMGVDRDAVVDPQLKVHGISGLRVVDASIMPRVVSGNTNAATMMIAEKGARMILEDHPVTRQ